MPTTCTKEGTPQTRDFLPEGQQCSKTFKGTPTPLLSILKNMMRFERPLITWDIFQDSAPATWPMAPTGGGAKDASGGGGQADEEEPLRDPRVVNNVTHAGMSHGEWSKGQSELKDEEWIEQVPSRLEEAELRDGRLYVVRLEEADGEMKLGLVKLEAVKSPPSWRAWWFERQGKSKSWPSYVKFQRYASSEAPWDNVELDPECFLMEVTDDNLTGAGAKARDEFPTLDGKFVTRLRLFAKREGYHVGAGDTTKRAHTTTGAHTSGAAAEAAPAAAAAPAAPKGAAKRARAGSAPAAAAASADARSRPVRTQKR